jgi:hypothetical protein
MRLSTWGKDMGQLLCEVDRQATCDPVGIIRCADCNFDIYQTLRSICMRMGAGQPL